MEYRSTASVCPFTLRAKAALWANAIVYGIGVTDNLNRGGHMRTMVRWYWAQLTMAMSAILVLNLAALYVLHLGRAEKGPLVATVALGATLIWQLLDAGEGLYFSFEDGEFSSSFLTSLPFLLLTLAALFAPEAREEAQTSCCV